MIILINLLGLSGEFESVSSSVIQLRKLLWLKFENKGIAGFPDSLDYHGSEKLILLSIHNKQL